MQESARTGDDGVRSAGATAIKLLILTGCRRGEVLGLQWQDVRGNRLKLRESKPGPRTVCLGDDARADRHVAELSQQPVAVPECPAPAAEATINHVWRNIRDKAGLPKVRLRGLRHTFASHTAINKETLRMIERLLGHADNQSTARYAHLDDVHVLDAAE